MLEKIQKMLAERYSSLQVLSAKANALSPLSVLSRGYSVIQGEGGIVKSIKLLSPNDDVKITLCDGTATATIKSITPTAGKRKTK